MMRAVPGDGLGAVTGDADVPPRRRFEVGLVLGWWTLFGIFLTGQHLLYNASVGAEVAVGSALGRAFLAAGVWAAITLVAFAMARRFPVDRRPLLRNVLIHTAAGMSVALAEVTIAYVVGRAIGLFVDVPFRSLVAQGFPTNFLSYWLLVGIGHGLEFYRRLRQRESQAMQLGARLAQAELHLLKSQLHPHFLFNTLHAISALMHRDVKAADRMIARLSDLLRASLDHAAATVVPLTQELEFLEAYLAIERIRLGDRLTVAMAIDPAALGAEVPHMILQPLVENAVRHGIAPRSAPGRIRVSAAVLEDGRTLELEVSDDGRGVNTAGAPRRDRGGGGLGLANTRARLEQLYGAAFEFAAGARDGGGFRVTLRFPLRSAHNLEEPATIVAVPDLEESGR
jgi:two-component system, LytTR family, sensor kinase